MRSQYTSDSDQLLRRLLQQCLYGIERISNSFATIKTTDDFLETDDGLRRYDSILINLQAIGENLKRIDKLTNGILLATQPEVPWENVIKLRDVISHHYFDLDAVIIYEVCNEHLAPLEGSLRAMVELLGD